MGKARHMTLIIHTAQYRYSGPDRLDITVKGQHPLGKYFAPNWEMVHAVKKYGGDAYNYYITEYNKILERVPNKVWSTLFKAERVVLVCFCGQGEFCHRNLLVDYIVNKNPSAYFAGFITN